MKRAICYLLFTLTSLTGLYAQFNENPILNLQGEDQRRLNWGYYLGINQYNYKIDYNEDLSSSNPNIGRIDPVQVTKNIGFNVGLIGELRINDYFDLRFEPGLYYNERNLYFINNPKRTSAPVKSTNIHLPLLLKASTKRMGNIKPFVVGGAAYSFNLSNNQGNKDGIEQGIITTRKTNYYWEVGLGIDIYLHYFKFSPSIRGSFAFKDDVYRGKDTDKAYFSGDNISGFYSKAIFLNFTFE